MRKNTESPFHVHYSKSTYLPWLAGPVTLKVKMKELEVTKFLYFWLIQQENNWWFLKRIIIPYNGSLNRSEKDTLMEVLEMKTEDVKKTLRNEISRGEDELDRHL